MNAARRDSSVGRPLFLETTIHIDRFWETVPRRRQIRRNLVGRRLFSSSYVFMEFQRTLLKDLVYVHSIVESDCDADADSRVFLGELQRKLAKRGGDHGARSVVRSFQVVACILDHFPLTVVNREELLEFLRYQIDFHRDKFFEVDLTEEFGDVVGVELSNVTDCDLVKDHLPVGDRRRYFCRRPEADCHLPEFLERYAAVLHEVHQAFIAASAGPSRHGNPRLADALGRVKRQPVDWQHAKGQKNCWPLGDTIIALEAPVEAAIYTTDHHYELICDIVGRVRYRELALDVASGPKASPGGAESTAL